MCKSYLEAVLRPGGSLRGKKGSRWEDTGIRHNGDLIQYGDRSRMKKYDTREEKRSKRLKAGDMMEEEERGWRQDEARDTREEEINKRKVLG